LRETQRSNRPQNRERAEEGEERGAPVGLAPTAEVERRRQKTEGASGNDRRPKFDRRVRFSESNESDRAPRDYG
jgi:hypothetical protein